MDAWIATTDGEHTQFVMRKLDVPQPAAGEILVRVRAAGLNRGELSAGHGLLKPGTEKTLGLEAAGEVVALGTNVTQFTVGQRVFGRARGSLASDVCMDVREAAPMPEHLSWAEAAAVPVAFIAAYEMLIDQAHIQPKEWLLITAITSGIGMAALQVAKLLGARVAGTSGSADKLAQLKAYGLDLAIVTRAPDFHEQMVRATDGRGADVVINNVGGSFFAECVRCLAPHGRLATIGYVDGIGTASIDLENLHARRLHLFGMSNKFMDVHQRAASARGFMEHLLPAIVNGRLRPVVDRCFEFNQLPAAVEYLASNLHFGKIILNGPA